MSRLRKIGFFITLIFDIYIKFLDLLFVDKFTIVLLVLLLSLSTTPFLLALNAFGALFDNPFIFNKEVSNSTILLKSLIKHW